MNQFQSPHRNAMTQDPILDSLEFNQRLFHPRLSYNPLTASTDIPVPVDGATLHMRLHHKSETSNAVLLFHGNGEVVSDYDRVAPLYKQFSCALAVVDYRGYGISTGSPTLRNSMEDAQLVFERFSEECAGKRLFVMGRSLGSSCASHLYGNIPVGDVAGFMIESGFTDLAALIARRNIRPEGDYQPLDYFSPLTKYAQNEHPIVILHGEQDTLIRPHEAQVAFDAARTARKSLVIIPGRGHNDISQSRSYWTALADFVGSV